MHKNVLREATYSSFISSSVRPECESQKREEKYSIYRSVPQIGPPSSISPPPPLAFLAQSPAEVFLSLA